MLGVLRVVISYFDIRPAAMSTERRPVSMRRQGPTPSEGGKRGHWLPQYLALVAGVVVQPYMQHYRATHAWDLTGVGGWIVFAAVAALVCLPAVYRRTVDPESPLFLQLIPVFTAGLGWESLFGTIVAAAGPN